MKGKAWHGSNIRIVSIELWMWPPMARPDSTAVGLLADSGGFTMPLPASDQYYCHSQVATSPPTTNLCKTTARQDCNPTSAQFRPGLALLHLPATILIDSGAMVYTTSKRPVLLQCKVKQKAGVPWTAHAALPTTPCMPCMGRGRALCIVLSTSLPSPRCRGSVARVEDQDRLAGVWRRLWCADQADVRCRMNPVHADHTATQRPPSSTASVWCEQQL